MAPPATIAASEEAGALILRAEGQWLVSAAAELDRRLSALEPPKGRRVILDLAGVERLDTAGAWLLLRTEQAFEAHGNNVELTRLRPSLEPLLEQLRSRGTISPPPHPIPAHHTFVGFLAQMGEVTVAIIRRGYSILGFFGLVCATVAR